jgi:hypothetical protein
LLPEKTCCGEHQQDARESSASEECERVERGFSAARGNRFIAQNQGSFARLGLRPDGRYVTG